MRLHDLGRPGEGQLSRLRLDHVQEGGPGAKKPFCINEACSNFTPEEKRGGWRKKTERRAGRSPCPGGGGGRQDRREEGSGRQKDHCEGARPRSFRRQSRGLKNAAKSPRLRRPPEKTAAKKTEEDDRRGLNAQAVSLPFSSRHRSTVARNMASSRQGVLLKGGLS